MSDELREKVARALEASELAWLKKHPGTVPEDVPYDWQADAAIALIRAEVLEEAARECGLSSVGLHFAAAIRVLKEKTT